MEIPVYQVLIDENDTSTGVFAISFTASPAIEEMGVALEEHKVIKLSKDEEKKIVTAPVLIPDKKIYRLDEEGNPYYIVFTKETIEMISQKFLKNGYQTKATDEHEIELDCASIVESWIIADNQKDKSTTLGFDLPVGTWMCSSKIYDDEYWQEVLSEKKSAFSIEGFFDFELKLNKTNKKEMKKSVFKTLIDMFKEIKLAEYKTADNKDVVVDDTTQEIMIDGEVPADGEYETEDGKILVVADGKLSEVKDKPADTSTTDTTVTATEEVEASDRYLTVYTTTDGTQITVEYVATAVDSDGAPIADGTYTTDSGMTLVVESGKVTDMQYNSSEDMSKENENLKKEIQTLKSQVETLKKTPATKSIKQEEKAEKPISRAEMMTQSALNALKK